MEIARRLGISEKAALKLKRRVQLFTSNQMEKFRAIIHNDIKHNFNDVMLPAKDTDITELVKDLKIPHADTVVLFSASQRCNNGRKRYNHTGQTASIYMNEKLGGKQVGTLVQSFGWKYGPVIYDSIHNLQANTVAPILKEYLPVDAPLFTDQGYTWWVSRNHRMINHSKKSSYKNSKWSRKRYSENGVHNQVAEGLNGLVKTAFKSYRWSGRKTVSYI